MLFSYVYIYVCVSTHNTYMYRFNTQLVLCIYIYTILGYDLRISKQGIPTKTYDDNWGYSYIFIVAIKWIFFYQNWYTYFFSPSYLLWKTIRMPWLLLIRKILRQALLEKIIILSVIVDYLGTTKKDFYTNNEAVLYFIQ
jgi:hypothetical protein